MSIAQLPVTSDQDVREQPVGLVEIHYMTKKELLELTWQRLSYDSSKVLLPKSHNP